MGGLNPEDIDFKALQALINVIEERAKTTADSSYTASLLSKGLHKCAEKLGEEAVETIIAIAANDKDQVVHESADLLYHLFVALKSAEVSFVDVLEELERREGVSGHVEKASRKKK